MDMKIMQLNRYYKQNTSFHRN